MVYRWEAVGEGMQGTACAKVLRQAVRVAHAISSVPGRQRHAPLCALSSGPARTL